MIKDEKKTETHIVKTFKCVIELKNHFDKDVVVHINHNFNGIFISSSHLSSDYTVYVEDETTINKMKYECNIKKKGEWSTEIE